MIKNSHLVVHQFNEQSNFQGVPIVQDNDQDSTDLMKCVASLRDKEALQDSTSVCFFTKISLGEHDSKF